MLCDSLCNKMIPPQPIWDMRPSPMECSQAPYEGAIIALVICVAIIIIVLIVKSILLKLHKSPETISVKEEDEIAKIKLKLKGDLMDKLTAFEEKLLAEESNKPEQAEGNKEQEQTEEYKKSKQAEVYRSTMMELIKNLDL